jgi:hypothetical protein
LSIWSPSCNIAFIGASPAGACRSIGLVVHLSRRGQAIEVLERHLMEPMHHSMFAGVRLLDLNGDGVEELVVEPDRRPTLGLRPLEPKPRP